MQTPPTPVREREPLLTVKEAATYLGVSTPTVRRLITNGELAAIFVLSTPRIRPSDLDAFVAGQPAA